MRSQRQKNLSIATAIIATEAALISLNLVSSEPSRATYPTQHFHHQLHPEFVFHCFNVDTLFMVDAGTRKPVAATVLRCYPSISAGSR
jgi:hypothetical protein